mgnify:CR=1 FL=1
MAEKERGREAGRGAGGRGRTKATPWGSVGIMPDEGKRRRKKKEEEPARQVKGGASGGFMNGARDAHCVDADVESSRPRA